MDIILSTVHWQLTLVSLDDIMIFSNSLEAHIEHKRLIPTLLRDGGVTIKQKKCEFFSNKINYGGHGIYPGQLVVSQHIMDAICDLKPPRNIR